MPSPLAHSALASAVLLTLGTAAPAVQGAETVTFLYEDYPPYTYQAGGKVQGTVAEKVEAIAAAAGLEVSWQHATFTRMLRSVANGKNGPAVCIAGYAATPERAETSWISKPFAMSPGSGIAVMRSNLAKFEGHETITEVLADVSISGAFLQGANYGDVQGPLIDAGKTRHLFIGGDDNALAMMVVRGRVDFAMVNADQVAYLQKVLPGGAGLVALTPRGMRAPAPEHILCSTSLASGIREHINEAIDELMPLSGADAPERDIDQ